MKIFGLKVTSIVRLDVGRTFRALIKKLISELAWKPRDESFEAFDRIISTCGVTVALMANHALIRVKRFVSSCTFKLCN